MVQFFELVILTAIGACVLYFALLGIGLFFERDRFKAENEHSSDDDGMIERCSCHDIPKAVCKKNQSS